MIQLFIAAVGAAALILTSGYAFGTVRRRRAVRELIEIREQLGSGDREWRATTATLISRELAELDRLSDPKARWPLFTLKAFTALFSVAFFAAILPKFIPVQTYKDASIYVAAGAGLVATFVLFGLTVYISGRLDKWWKQFLGFALAVTFLMVGPVVVLIVLDGTPYHATIFAR